MEKPSLRVVEGGSMDKQKALQAALDQIDKNFGKGSIMRLGANDKRIEVEAISTGSLGLDIALGIGGLPRGRVIEIYGPESSGKTTLALQVVAEAQKKGGIGAFVDAEHALDPVYARKLGVKVEDLLISQPDAGEQALEIADTLVRSGAIDVLVVDSVAALVPRAELDGPIGDRHAGVQANLLSQALRRLCGHIARAQVAVLVTNQLRERAGTPGAPTYTAGGRALGYYASVRLHLRLLEHINHDGHVVGSRVRVSVTKNKVAPAWQTADLDVLADRGICWEAGLLDLGVQAGLVSRQGGWYACGEVRLGQGRAHASRRLAEHPELAQQLEARLRTHDGPDGRAATA